VLERHINNVKNIKEMDVVESIIPPLYFAPLLNLQHQQQTTAR
jgi:hypothetical protein